MKTRNRWKAELPSDVTDVLQHMKSVKDSSGLHAYIVALREKGWSLSAIAKPLDFSRERVRQLSVTHPFDISYSQLQTNSNGHSVPELPTKPVVEKVKRVVVAPDPSAVSRLLELKPMAQAVRGKSQKYRAQGEEYTRLIAQEIARGVTPSHLAKELGVTHSALNFRLVRYGYSETSSSAKCYQPIAYGETN